MSTTDNKQNNKQLKSKGGILAMHETAHFDGASNIKSRRHKKKTGAPMTKPMAAPTRAEGSTVDSCVCDASVAEQTLLSASVIGWRRYSRRNRAFFIVVT